MTKFCIQNNPIPQLWLLCCMSNERPDLGHILQSQTILREEFRMRKNKQSELTDV